jgi:hypothetical protein
MADFATQSTLCRTAASRQVGNQGREFPGIWLEQRLPSEKQRPDWRGPKQNGTTKNYPARERQVSLAMRFARIRADLMASACVELTQWLEAELWRLREKDLLGTTKIRVRLGKLNNGETGSGRALGKALIGRDKSASRRTMLAPREGRRELQAISGPQPIGIE